MHGLRAVKSSLLGRYRTHTHKPSLFWDAIDGVLFIQLQVTRQRQRRRFWFDARGETRFYVFKNDKRYLAQHVMLSTINTHSHTRQ